MGLASREEILRKAYELGFKYEQKYGGCTQCAIAAVFEALGLEVDESVFKAGTGLSGGLGLCGEGTCGALLGASMVISYLYPRTRREFPYAEGKMQAAYRLVKELSLIHI